jgi:hypothetical protein
VTEPPVSWLLIEQGWAVVTADEAGVGHVHRVLGDENADIFDGLAVAAAEYSRTVYVPSEQVGTITEGRVALLIGQAEVGSLDHFEEPPPVIDAPPPPSAWERFTSWFRGPRAR